MADYVLTPDAEKDVDQLYAQGIERHGLRQADLYLDGLFERFAQLADLPGVGTVLTLPDGRRAQRVFYGKKRSHVIIYEAMATGVKILRVFHTSSDYRSTPMDE